MKSNETKSTQNLQIYKKKKRMLLLISFKTVPLEQKTFMTLVVQFLEALWKLIFVFISIISAF
jgi:hypothetical protein